MLDIPPHLNYKTRLRDFYILKDVMNCLETIYGPVIDRKNVIKLLESKEYEFEKYAMIRYSPTDSAVTHIYSKRINNPENDIFIKRYKSYSYEEKVERWADIIWERMPSGTILYLKSFDFYEDENFLVISSRTLSQFIQGQFEGAPRKTIVSIVNAFKKRANMLGSVYIKNSRSAIKRVDLLYFKKTTTPVDIKYSKDKTYTEVVEVEDENGNISYDAVIQFIDEDEIMMYRYKGTSLYDAIDHLKAVTYIFEKFTIKSTKKVRHGVYSSSRVQNSQRSWVFGKNSKITRLDIYSDK